jgi:hypothetical protein
VTTVMGQRQLAQPQLLQARQKSQVRLPFQY